LVIEHSRERCAEHSPTFAGGGGLEVPLQPLAAAVLSCPPMTAVPEREIAGTLRPGLGVTVVTCWDTFAADPRLNL
jgi:hypothetical protein